MATVLLLGRDEPLLEGLAQSLAAAGHPSLVASTLADALAVTGAEPPLVAVVEREIALEHPEVSRLRVKPGGALIVFHTIGAAATPLGPAMQRQTLADLALPLERKRLVALVGSLVSRARRVGRDAAQDTQDSRSK